jgi:hypothetical protein
MHPRLHNMAALLRRQMPWARAGMRPSAAQSVCRSCYQNFSTSPLRQALKGAAKGTAKEKQQSECAPWLGSFSTASAC